MIFVVVFLLLFLIVIRFRRKSDVVAFFHPYCNAGGGGERVLWSAIRLMQKNYPHVQFVIYSGDCDATMEQILLKVKQRFGIRIESTRVNFVFLRLRRLVEADLYPCFTLLAQTLAAFILGLEALLKLNPEVFVDSMGYSATLPLFRWVGGCRVATYIHYPTISSDMIDLVSRREQSYNNADLIVQSSIFSHAKMLYYRLFAFLYCILGQAADVVMVNGSWTCGHIKRMWRCKNAKIVFPPCDVTAFLSLDQTAEARQVVQDLIMYEKEKIVKIVSIGQIRPEKNHKMQLEVLRMVKEKLDERDDGTKIQLTIAGGCRNHDDLSRVMKLKDLCSKWKLTSQVNWKLNISYEELLDVLSESLIFLHTMWNEHFGISVVEGMAAGTIMLAHDSGGPQMDIVLPIDGCKEKQPTGFLAATKEEYVRLILHIIDMKRDEREAVREAARKSVSRFCESTFEQNWDTCIKSLLT